MEVWIELLANYGLVLVLLGVGFSFGRIAEARHFRSIRAREGQLRNVTAITCENLPAQWSANSGGLVSGSVVISLDYFKRFLAGFRAIFGGRIRAYEPLMERGRREALVRMKQLAADMGYDAIINVRLETSTLARASGQGTAGVEVLAFGTGIRFER